MWSVITFLIGCVVGIVAMYYYAPKIEAIRRKVIAALGTPPPPAA